MTDHKQSEFYRDLPGLPAIVKESVERARVEIVEILMRLQRDVAAEVEYKQARVAVSVVTGTAIGFALAGDIVYREGINIAPQQIEDFAVERARMILSAIMLSTKNEMEVLLPVARRNSEDWPLYVKEKTPPPTSNDQHMARFAENYRISGTGADVKTHFPCPFCAAPDWLVQPITDGRNGYKVLAAVTTCGECGRSAKFIVTRHAGGVSAECVQTGGDEQPEWLEPKIRRLEG